MLRDIFMFIFFEWACNFKELFENDCDKCPRNFGLNSIFEKYIHKIREHNPKFWVLLTSGAHKWIATPDRRGVNSWCTE